VEENLENEILEEVSTENENEEIINENLTPENSAEMTEENLSEDLENKIAEEDFTDQTAEENLPEAEEVATNDFVEDSADSAEEESGENLELKDGLKASIFNIDFPPKNMSNGVVAILKTWAVAIWDFMVFCFTNFVQLLQQAPTLFKANIFNEDLIIDQNYTGGDVNLPKTVELATGEFLTFPLDLDPSTFIRFYDAVPNPDEILSTDFYDTVEDLPTRKNLTLFVEISDTETDSLEISTTNLTEIDSAISLSGGVLQIGSEKIHYSQLLSIREEDGKEIVTLADISNQSERGFAETIKSSHEINSEVFQIASWRGSSVSQNRSWFTESGKFPEKVFLTAGNFGVDLIDASKVKTNDLQNSKYLSFENDAGAILNSPVKVAKMKNARLFAGLKSGNTFVSVNFKNEDIYRYTTAGRAQFAGNISDRNGGSGFNSVDDLFKLPGAEISAIDIFSRETDDLIAIGTNSGIAILKLDPLISVNDEIFLAGSNSNSCGISAVQFDAAGNLFYSDCARKVYRVAAGNYLSADFAADSNSTLPAEIFDFATAENYIFVGTNSGVEKLQI
jgi:hypothetical protein